MCTTLIPIEPSDAQPMPWRTEAARRMMRVFAAVAVFDVVIVAATLRG